MSCSDCASLSERVTYLESVLETIQLAAEGEQQTGTEECIEKWAREARTSQARQDTRLQEYVREAHLEICSKQSGPASECHICNPKRSLKSNNCFADGCTDPLSCICRCHSCAHSWDWDEQGQKYCRYCSVTVGCSASNDYALEERVRKYDTVKRGNCRDCGNPWWFSMEDCYVCTTCAKTHGRDTSDPYVPKATQTVTCPDHEAVAWAKKQFWGYSECERDQKIAVEAYLAGAASKTPADSSLAPRLNYAHREMQALMEANAVYRKALDKIGGICGYSEADSPLIRDVLNLAMNALEHPEGRALNAESDSARAMPTTTDVSRPDRTKDG